MVEATAAKSLIPKPAGVLANNSLIGGDAVRTLYQTQQILGHFELNCTLCAHKHKVAGNHVYTAAASFRHVSTASRGGSELLGLQYGVSGGLIRLNFPNGNFWTRNWSTPLPVLAESDERIIREVGVKEISLAQTLHHTIIPGK